MKKITITITFEEINKIFKALGKEAFNDVYELIGHLNEQANAQLNATSIENSKKRK